MKSRIAVALVAVLLVAGCANDQPAEPAAAPSTIPHAAHTGGSAPPSTPLRDGERFADLGLPRPYTPAAPNGGTDEYRCFLIDPKLTEPAFLTGSRFLPQNAAILHHAIVYRLDPEQARAAAYVDGAVAGEGWTCFGNTGVLGQSAWVAQWAPGGSGEALTPKGYGFPMPPGSKLVMQVHYNLLGAGDGAATSDQSGLQMRFADESAQLKPLETTLAVAPIELPCEPGGAGPLCDRETAVADVAKRFGAESGENVERLVEWCSGGKPRPGNTQSCNQPVKEAGRIHMAAGHMHLLGRSIKIELNPGTAKAQTILDVPNYDFDNQELVPLKKPIEVATGDTIRVTCTHDATLRGKLPQLKSLPSRYVVWGEGTSDEMCLGIMVMSES